MPNNHDASYKQLFSHPEVVRDLVLGFIPDQWMYLYLLIEFQSRTDRWMAAIVRIEHPANAESLMQVIDQLDHWLTYNSEIRRTLAIWIRGVILRKSKQRLSLPAVINLKELKMTVANRYEQWMEEWKQQGLKLGFEQGIEQGIERGIEQGIEKGEALLLQRQLARRFGPLPQTVLKRIASASITELELWGDRVLDAASLDDVFAD
jgi:predicted transposase YdaD